MRCSTRYACVPHCLKLQEDELVAREELQKLQGLRADANQEEIKSHMAELKQQIIVISKERQQAAEGINTDALGHIVLKNKDVDSHVHDLFRWVLTFFYKDSGTNYYWGNFKNEAFLNDKGADFKARVGKIKAVDLKRDELIKTDIIMKVEH